MLLRKKCVDWLKKIQTTFFAKLHRNWIENQQHLIFLRAQFSDEIDKIVDINFGLQIPGVVLLLFKLAYFEIDPFIYITSFLYKENDYILKYF